MNNPDHEVAQIEDSALVAFRAAYPIYSAFVKHNRSSPRVRKSIVRVIGELREYINELGEDPPVTLDRDELKRAVHYLAFEIHYFRLYSRLLKEGKSMTCGLVFHQAMSDSLLLHFRVLVDFFYNGPRGDDRAVTHFRALPDFGASFPEQLTRTHELRQVSDDLNKRLAHLTAARWRAPQPDMDHYSRHFEGICKLIDMFHSALPEDIRGVLDARLRHWEQLATTS